MINSTTPTLEGKTISKYLGVVTGEAILGANVFKDFFAGIRDIVGGRSAAYEKELHKVIDEAAIDGFIKKVFGELLSTIGNRYAIPNGTKLSMINLFEA